MDLQRLQRLIRVTVTSSKYKNVESSLKVNLENILYLAKWYTTIQIWGKLWFFIVNSENCQRNLIASPDQEILHQKWILKTQHFQTI